MNLGRAPRLSAFFMLALGSGACAHMEPPPGGPEDLAPPELIVTRPDSLAVRPGWSGPAVLVFNERVSERGLQDAVTVSPRTSTVQVQHRGDEVRVSLRGGWEPGVVYHVTLLPDVQDLFNNRLEDPVRLVFSTGPEIPDTWAEGVVTDRITGRPEVGIRVEAVRAADSLVYSLPTDSAGRFVLTKVPEGEYEVRAFRDLNRNRALDEFEPRDSLAATVSVGDTVRAELAVLMPDTTPAAIASVELQERKMELRFDDHLDPEQEIAPGRVEIRSAAGGYITVDDVSVGEPREERRPARSPDEPPPPEPADPRPAAPAAAPARPLPTQRIVITLDEEAQIEPEAVYTIRVRGVRNINGLVADAEFEWTAPEEPGS